MFKDSKYRHTIIIIFTEFAYHQNAREVLDQSVLQFQAPFRYSVNTTDWYFGHLVEFSND